MEIAALLESLGFEYMVIGAAAAGLWGEPRATLDVDVTLWVSTELTTPPYSQAHLRPKPLWGRTVSCAPIVNRRK